MERICPFIWCIMSLLLAESKQSYLSPKNFLLTGPKADQAYADSVAKGMRLGIEECQHQFRWEVWNCPLHQSQALLSLNPMPVTRELSFAQAISCSGVAYAVTRDCSLGILDNCKCDENRLSGEGGYSWQWGGCSANLRFGERVSRMYMDERESASDMNAKVKLHNNEAGRRALRRNMKMTCKCHGATGSCTTKTCWQKLPNFHDVGDYLKKRYKSAVLVNAENGALHNSRRRRRRSKVGHKDLLYLQESPDYCRANGTHATLGRQCMRPRRDRDNDDNKRNPHTRSCQRLCKDCGLKVRRTTLMVSQKCNCHFHWCCDVICETCTKNVSSFFCTR